MINNRDVSARHLEPWLAAEHVQKTYNRDLFDHLEPLETVEWVLLGEVPEVAARDHSEISGDFKSRLEKQLEWLSNRHHNVAVSAFAPELVPLKAEDLPEEALVRSVALESLAGVMAVCLARSRNPQLFEAGRRDMLKILTAHARPVHRYSFLKLRGRDFISSALRAASRHGAITTIDDRKEQFETFARATFPVIIDPPRPVARQILKTTGLEVPEELIVGLDRRRRSIHQEGQTKAEEPAHPAGPKLTALFREYEFGGRGDVPTEAIRGINKLYLNKLTLKDMLNDPEVAEPISQTAILAYLEELAWDGVNQSSPVNVMKQIGKITRSSDEQPTDQILVHETSADITRGILELANEFAGLGRQLISISDNSHSDTKRAYSRLFAPVGSSFSDMPRAFAVIRFGLTRFGKQPIGESPSTKRLGNHVNGLLDKTVASEAPVSND
jgi:hypothetical protein